MDHDPLPRQVGEKSRRHLRAANRGVLWFGLGTFGMVGYTVVLPTLIGLALGVYADRRWGGHVSWSLTGLAVGLFLGCLAAGHWVQRQQKALRDDPERNQGGQGQP